MKTHLCFILLAAGVWAAPHTSSAAELLTLLERIYDSVTADMQVSSRLRFSNLKPDIFNHPNLRIETPLHTDNANCVNKIFEGTELLKNQLDMKKFGAFFQKFERLKQSLTLRPGKEEECDTERKTPKNFIEKLKTA
uniref:Interleukin-5 n=1 Tax=Dromaius novaehollandiae TaxID=8790 RepID=A0A8C4JUR2_DRONO